LAEKIPELSEEDIDMMAESAYSNDDDEGIDDEPLEDETKEERKARKEKEKEEKKANKEAAKEEKKANKEAEKEEKKANKEAEKEERERKKEERKAELEEEKKKRKEELKKIFKEKLEQIKLEVVELKDKIRAAAFQFFNKFKEVSKAFILSLVKVATSLPGAITMIVAPPWNVPFAITTLLILVIDYLDILAKIQTIVPFFQPLRKIPTLVDKSKINTIGASLDVVVLGLSALYGPVLGLKKFIDKIIDFIKSLFGPKRQQKIFKQATKKLVKLGHIKSIINRPVMVVENEEGKLRLRKKGIDRGPDFPLEPIQSIKKTKNGVEIENGKEEKVRVFSYNEDDNEEIISLLNQFKIGGGSKWGGTTHVIGYRQDNSTLKSVIDDLEGELEDNKLPKDIDTSEFEQFVYDITLSDGTVIPNISEDGLEYYKNKFDLIFKALDTPTANN
jgi:molecular chaperone GrpE (heat shock protein)